MVPKRTSTYEQQLYWALQRHQAMLGTLAVPPVLLVNLDANNPLDKILLSARKANSTAMCLLRISLTDNIRLSALYNSKTTELPGGSAQKAWDNLLKLFYPININKMNQLKGDFVRSTLYKDGMNPDEWFADLYSFRQRLTDDYKLTTFGDEEMTNQIIYFTKPQAYQMQLTVIKDQLAMEAIRFEKDNTYVKEATLESVQGDLCHYSCKQDSRSFKGYTCHASD
jgi:hypothetical protein